MNGAATSKRKAGDDGLRIHDNTTSLKENPLTQAAKRARKEVRISI
jgi:hypothetical protein